MNLWRPLDQANKVNPYPMYEELRASVPIYRATTGEWILTRYEDVRSVLTDRTFGVGNRKEWLQRGVNYLANKQMDLSYITAAINSFILQLDPPHHTRIRRFIADNWDRTNIESIIEHNVTTAIDRIDQDNFDLVADFTSQIPASNICDIMGISSDDHQHLHGLSNEMIKALDLYVSVKDLVQLNEASHEFITYFKKKIQKREYGDGLLKWLHEANIKQTEPLSESEFISVMIFLFVAGEETSVSFLSLAIFHIYSNSLIDEYKNRDKIGTRIEELLRYDSPVQLLGRFSNRDVELNGVKIQKGDTLTLAVGAANRDPDVFDNPHAIIADRNPKHLSFGKGIHFCLGDWLAKTTAIITIPKFINSFGKLTFIGEPENWYDNIAIRGFQNLKITAAKSSPPQNI